MTIHMLETLYPHSSNYAHAVEVPAGARMLISNGQIGTMPDGTTPEDIEGQTEVVFDRLEEILAAAGMTFGNIVRFNTYLTEAEYQDAYKAIRDRRMGDHKPAATLLIVKALARPNLKIEIEIIAAKDE